MAWEARNGKYRYYTRSSREGDRVVRQYIGSGESAELIAASDSALRTARKLRLDDAQERYHRIEGIVDLVCDRTAAVMRETLMSAGCHQHKRGEWRKRRGNKRSNIDN